MQQFDKIGKVDILNCVCRLRQMRGMTVQTESQYRWIHMVMLRYMQGKLFKRESAGRGASTSGAGMCSAVVPECLCATYLRGQSVCIVYLYLCICIVL
eukprot:m.1302597 g.1302597  ORF g.1302597 m.1302597 type:complete len:98 (+) comp24808_c0_seq6:335-628(+)